MNKIAAVTMAKNEEDIIESCIRHALTYADEFYFCDHKSTDRTLEIVQSLQNEGLPIHITIHNKESHDQAEVVNELINAAIKNGAKIITPIDADEFIIMPKKSSADIRNFLQHLNTNHNYQIIWTECMLVESEKDQDKFILSRPSLRDKNTGAAPKVLIGVDDFVNRNLKISGGNHFVTFQNDEKISDIIFCPVVENFHYRVRSSSQWLLKDLTKVLVKTAYYSKFFGGNGGIRPSVDNFLKDNTLDASDPTKVFWVTEPISADEDLQHYKDECKIVYLRGGGGHSFKKYFFAVKKFITSQKFRYHIN